MVPWINGALDRGLGASDPWRLVLVMASAKYCFVWEIRKFQVSWQDSIIVGAGGGGRGSNRGGRGSKPQSKKAMKVKERKKKMRSLIWDGN